MFRPVPTVALCTALLGLLPASAAGEAEPVGETGGTIRLETIPARPADAPTGSEFARRTTGWDGRRRQASAVEELLRGNVPESLRTLRAITLTHVTPDGTRKGATVWVLPDYLAIGSDEDFLYMPLTLPSATRVANAWACTLPTRKIVDAVHEQADLLLEPIPMEPGPKMRSAVYYLKHQRLIDEQRAGAAPGGLVSGHKKDVVLTNRLASSKGRIAIYGWHHKDGKPIQPLSTVHGQRYADYSHGLRLVWSRVLIDGGLRSIFDLLQDSDLAPLLTYEGVIRTPRKLMHTSGEPWGD